MTVWPDGSPSSYSPPKPDSGGSGLRSTSEYGMRTNPGTGAYTLHAGIDLIGVSDGLNRAAVDGTVTRAEWYGSYGNCVDVKGSNGDIFRYAHNKSFKVKKGDKVSEGEAVAVWDSTGNSTGTHTHYETHPNGGDAIDPRDYMRAQTEDGNMATLETINTPFKYGDGQSIGTTEEYLYINDDHDVSVAFGPKTAVWGSLYVSFSVTKPPTVDGSTFQVRGVIETYENGKVTDSYSLGTQEFIYTVGKTLGFVTVPPVALGKDRRLRFRGVTYDGAAVKMVSVRFRGAQVD